MLAYRRPHAQAAAAAPAAGQRPKLVAALLEPQHVADALRGRDAVVFAKAEWCPHCRALDPEFRAWAQRWPFSSAIVLVEKERGDAAKRPEADKFRRTYQITGWPTVLLIRADGRWKKYSERERSAEAIARAAEAFFAQK